jgi:CheY-like chemotaxis protein
VRQILFNLLSNAMKFTQAGEVRVVLTAPGETLRLCVADTGVGIAPEALARLFQKFEQADASTTRRYGGTGLGLSICRDLAEMMGGTITAQSEVGQGSAFTVDLPLPPAEAPVGPAHGDAAAEIDADGVKVLAAEDNHVNQLVLKTLLGQSGVEPVVVANGREALDAWRREDWDVILMDVQMPVMDGPGATRTIRAAEAASGRPRTPIIALTANAMTHQLDEYRAAGMDGVVAKPINVADLFDAIAAAMEDAQAQAEPAPAEVREA